MEHRTAYSILIGTLVLGIVGLVSAWYVFDLRYLSSSEIVTLGIPYSANNVASLRATTELKQIHPSRTTVKYIPFFESDGENITIPEAFQVPEELQQDTIVEGIFLQELIANSPAKANQYLLARSSNLDTLEWQAFARYVDESLIETIENIEGNISEYADKYQEDYEQAMEFAEQNNIQREDISATILNGEVHNIGTSPTTYSLRTSITKSKLRDGNNLFGEESPAKLFGLEYASATPKLEGFNEAYQDLDCNDRSDAYGSLEDGASPYARCEYSAANELDIKIVYHEDYDPRQDTEARAEQAEQITRRFLQANFKNLLISEWQEEDYGRDIGSTKTESGNPPFSVLIDEEVRNAPAFDLFLSQQILIELSQDKFYLNTDQVLQF